MLSIIKQPIKNKNHEIKIYLNDTFYSRGGNIFVQKHFINIIYQLFISLRIQGARGKFSPARLQLYGVYRKVAILLTCVAAPEHWRQEQGRTIIYPKKGNKKVKKSSHFD
jgi:hypothetical protein